MIVVLAGTSDARQLALRLLRAGYPVLASTGTENGARELEKEGVPVRWGRLDEEGMTALLRESGAHLVVDASHPFAEEAHKTAMRAAAAAGIPYLRYERPSQEDDIAADPLVTVVDSYEAAAEEARRRKGTVFLTTGSKTLELFAQKLLPDPDIRLVVRVLPTVENLEKCARLGIAQRNIIAIQGPFSETLNRALYEHVKPDVIVTKESGKEGSVAEKLQAARVLGIPVILIRRPRLAYDRVCTTFDAVLDAVRHLYAKGGIARGVQAADTAAGN